MTLHVIDEYQTGDNTYFFPISHYDEGLGRYFDFGIEVDTETKKVFQLSYDTEKRKLFRFDMVELWYGKDNALTEVEHLIHHYGDYGKEERKAILKLVEDVLSGR